MSAPDDATRLQADQLDATRLQADQLEVYLAVLYPQMPVASREAIVCRYMGRPINGRLPLVAGIMTTNHARHKFTKYDVLLDKFTKYDVLLDELSERKSEQPRKEARRLVANDLNRIIKKWRRGAPVSHPELKKIRRSYRRIRQQQKRPSAFQLVSSDVIAGENAETAKFCRRWLSGHLRRSTPSYSSILHQCI